MKTGELVPHVGSAHRAPVLMQGSDGPIKKGRPRSGAERMWFTVPIFRGNDPTLVLRGSKSGMSVPGSPRRRRALHLETASLSTCCQCRKRRVAGSRKGMGQKQCGTDLGRAVNVPDTSGVRDGPVTLCK